MTSDNQRFNPDSCSVLTNSKLLRRIMADQDASPAVEKDLTPYQKYRVPTTAIAAMTGVKLPARSRRARDDE